MKNRTGPKYARLGQALAKRKGLLTGCGTLSHTDRTVFLQQPSVVSVERECQMKLIVFSALIEAALDASNDEQKANLVFLDPGQ